MISSALQQAQQESSGDRKAGQSTDPFDSSSTVFDSSKLDHTLLVGSQATYPAGSVLHSVGTGYTESALMGESVLTPEALLQSSILASGSKASVGIPSRAHDKNRHSSASQPGGLDILLKIQKEGLYNFKQLPEQEETKETKPLSPPPKLQASNKASLRLSTSPKRSGNHEEAWNRLHGPFDQGYPSFMESTGPESPREGLSSPTGRQINSRVTDLTYSGTTKTSGACSSSLGSNFESMKISLQGSATTSSAHHQKIGLDKGNLTVIQEELMIAEGCDDELERSRQTI